MIKKSWQVDGGLSILMFLIAAYNNWDLRGALFLSLLVWFILNPPDSRWLTFAAALLLFVIAVLLFFAKMAISYTLATYLYFIFIGIVLVLIYEWFVSLNKKV